MVPMDELAGLDGVLVAILDELPPGPAERFGNGHDPAEVSYGSDNLICQEHRVSPYHLRQRWPHAPESTPRGCAGSDPGRHLSPGLAVGPCSGAGPGPPGRAPIPRGAVWPPSGAAWPRHRASVIPWRTTSASPLSRKAPCPKMSSARLRRGLSLSSSSGSYA